MKTELRTGRKLFTALGNGEKDRELKEFVGYHASVSHQPRMSSEVHFGRQFGVHFGFWNQIC